MKKRIDEGKPLNLNDQLNAIRFGLLPPLQASSLFPTPQSRDYRSGQAERIGREGKQNNLNDLVKLWSTPRAGNPGSRPNRKGGKVLAEEVKKRLWPTQDVRGFTNNGSLKMLADMTEGLGEFFGMAYRASAKKKIEIFGTPTANNAKNTITGSQAGRGTLTADLVELGARGQLSPDWVERLMGYPDGWTDIHRESVDMKNYYPAAWIDGKWDTIPHVATGVKNRVKRLKGLGNAVVPQIAAMILLMILEAMLRGEI